MTGKQAVRELGKRYAEIAALPRQQETIDRWRKLNGLDPVRPMVRLEQLPWDELDWGADQMVNTEGPLAPIERRLRMTIYAQDNFPADMVVLPYLGIAKTVNNARLGPVWQVDRIGLSQHYAEQLTTLEEVRALETPTIQVDPELDQQRLAELSEVLDGVLPVKLVGHIRHSGLWDRITTLISPQRVLFDLIDRPEYVAELIAKFVEMEMGVLDQFEAHGLLEAPAADIHCTGAFADELPSADYDEARPLAKDTWTFSMAQMFSDVSPAMHEQFDIQPLKPLLDRYGLVYYGCCEPLHHKIDIIRKLNTVRKISASPWADKEKEAEAIGGDYVLSAKPNPAYLAMDRFDGALVRKELQATVAACRRHGTPCEMILKDVSTVRNDPARLREWEQIAMEVAEAA
jgi:hypothetical protein